jgi:ABC-type tungstate transport system permease subunit
MTNLQIFLGIIISLLMVIVFLFKKLVEARTQWWWERGTDMVNKIFLNNPGVEIQIIAGNGGEADLYAKSLNNDSLIILKKKDSKIINSNLLEKDDFRIFYGRHCLCQNSRLPDLINYNKKGNKDFNKIKLILS